MAEARHGAIQAEGESCDSSSVTLPAVARYRTAADKQAAYRRRQAGLPVDTPRMDNRHGRRGLR
jgi:hypothetical protein